MTDNELQNIAENNDDMSNNNFANVEFGEERQLAQKKEILTGSAKPLTKLEGVVMFATVIVTVLLCAFGLTSTYNKTADELLTAMDDLEFRVSVDTSEYKK